MHAQRNQYYKSPIWPVEPKAPSLVSLSVRDQNVLRLPERSSSLKSTARGLKKGLSSNQLLARSVKENTQALHRRKHGSCSSLAVQKTRYADPARSCAFLDDRPNDMLEQRVAFQHSESIRPDKLAPHLGARDRNPQNMISPHSQPMTGAVSAASSSETIVRSSATDDSGSATFQNARLHQHEPRVRQSSARRFLHKMKQSMQKRDKCDMLGISPNDDRRDNYQCHERQLTTTGPYSDQISSLDISLDSLPDASSLDQESSMSTSLRSRAGSITSLSGRNSWPHRCRLYEYGQAEFGSRSTEALQTSNDHPKPRVDSIRRPLLVRIAARADLQEASLMSAQSTWAVVQIHAQLPALPADSPLCNDSIAVTLVIDNSRLATRKDIKKACLEVMTLAGSFCQGADYIGIYCTSGTNLADTCLLPLSPLSLNLLQRKLEEVPKRPRNSYRVQDAFLQAAQALRTLRMQSHARIPQIMEDIVIITTSAIGLSCCRHPDLASFRVHLVNPSLIPYSNSIRRQLHQRTRVSSHTARDGHYSDGGPTNGSDSMSGGWLLDAARCISEDCEKHASHSLIEALRHSRSQADAGQITNVSITLHERDDAIIENVRGDLAFPSLMPGQIVSIPVRIRMKPLNSRHSVTLMSDLRSSLRMSMVDAISELEMSLGNHLSELFEVQVSYNHSFFPESTRLEARESCWLPRISPPDQVTRLGTDGSEETCQVYHNCRVQKQLALCMAASDAPAQALQDLDDIGAGRLSGSTQHFMDALKRRMRHRIALYGDVSFMDYFLASEYVELVPTAFNEQGSYELYLEELIEAHIAGTEEEQGYQSNAASTVIRRRPCQPTSSNAEEEARRIWQHIRRTSRPGEPPNLANKDDVIAKQHDDPHMEELRTTALKHGRKISSATLRSLAKDFHSDASIIQEEEENYDEGIDRSGF